MQSVDEVTAAEAIAALGPFQELADWFGEVPFAKEAGPVRIREVLMWRLIMELVMLRADKAAEIAAMAARDVEPEGDRRVLGIGWRYTTPRLCWMSHDIPLTLSESVFVVPVAARLEELIRRIEEHRRTAGRPN